jgi:hypothetical protein
MNLGIIIIIVIAALWGLGMFFGVIGGFSKTFSPTPVAMDSSSSKTKEQQIVDDTKQKQQQMMDDIKQKMEDQQQQRN